LKTLKKLFQLLFRSKDKIEMSTLKNPNVTADDLDFSDIGRTEEKPTQDYHYDPVPKKKLPPQATGITIAVPLGGNYWSMRDLADCTAEEFFAFAKSTYPAVNPAHIDSYANLTTRVRAYGKILEFHSVTLKNYFPRSKDIPVQTKLD
jgi:hypothetical protein